MKYIRTKDGRIIKIYDEDIDNEIAGIKFDVAGLRLQTTMQLNCISKEDILKIADTIEELCDEYVYHLKSGGKFIDEKLANKFDIYENVYGAIWTDKGLIYVAKMNEKGELELL